MLERPSPFASLLQLEGLQRAPRKAQARRPMTSLAVFLLTIRAPCLFLDLVRKRTEFEGRRGEWLRATPG
jgi:hypothetical protein